MPNFAVIHFNAENQHYEFVRGPNTNESFTAVDGTEANAAACLAHDKNGKYVAFNTSGPNAANYTTFFETFNSNLEFVADTPGVDGNNIRIRYVVAGNNTPLTVGLVGTDITVNLATDGSGVPTSTATQIKAALDGNGAIAALINTNHVAGSTGAGIPESSFTFVPLQFGSSGAAVATIVEQIEATNTTTTTY